MSALDLREELDAAKRPKSEEPLPAGESVAVSGHSVLLQTAAAYAVGTAAVLAYMAYTGRNRS